MNEDTLLPSHAVHSAAGCRLGKEEPAGPGLTWNGSRWAVELSPEAAPGWAIPLGAASPKTGRPAPRYIGWRWPQRLLCSPEGVLQEAPPQPG